MYTAENHTKYLLGDYYFETHFVTKNQLFDTSKKTIK